VGRSDIDLVADIAVGVDRGGADGWLLQDWLAPATLGAPPDAHNIAGQDWGLAALDPRWLLGAGRDIFTETIAACTWAAGLRMDHAAGYWRQWWRPDSVNGGCYIDTGGIAAAGQWVVAEDLGCIPAAVRPGLAALGMWGFRLTSGFDDLGATPESCAAYTTHDLPTAIGCGELTDSDDQASCGVPVDRDGLKAARARLKTARHDGDGWPEAAARTLATSGAGLLITTVDDAAGCARRANMPGVGPDRWPSWRQPLPPLGTWKTGGLGHAANIAHILNDAVSHQQEHLTTGT
jgi:4-alpha-glucanotransferase